MDRRPEAAPHLRPCPGPLGQLIGGVASEEGQEEGLVTGGCISDSDVQPVMESRWPRGVRWPDTKAMNVYVR